jgi:signal transduction histidine kinase
MTDKKEITENVITIICDAQGVIEKISSSDNCTIGDEHIGKMLCSIVDTNSVQKCLDFLTHLKEDKSLFNWEMSLKCNQQGTVYNISGAFIEDKLLIFAAEYPHDITRFWKQMMTLQNDYLTMVRKILKEKNSTSSEEHLLNDYTKLNNELVKTQRELMKKNVILNKQDEHIKLMNQILRHDLANQYSVIISAVNLFREEKDDSLLSEIKNKAYAGIELIRKMKNLDKFFPDKRSLHKVSVKKVLEDIKSDHGDIELNISGEGQIFADDSIYSLINNIVENAKVHGGATEISVDIIKGNENIIVELFNNGKQIPESIIDKVFDQRFSYGEKGNTGLGLFIAKQMMEFYSGSISLKNEEERGVTFILKFPKKKEPLQ